MMTYKEITNAAEAQIRRLIAAAERFKDPEDVRVHTARAFGMYECWEAITIGMASEADAARLYNLIDNAEKEVP